MPSAPSGAARVLHTIGGPLVFVVLLLLPLPATPYAIRGSIGLLLWMSWWWLAAPVDLAVTALLPPAVVALFNLLPVAGILTAYADPLVFLLLGANMLSTLWQRWGLDRRIALVSFLAIGSGARQQVATWFIVAAILSAVLPNAVVAATLVPIVIAMLRFLGIEAASRSAFGSALLIAIAWGTSVGGAGTPLGGAHNLLTVQLLEQQLLHREFLFTTWVVRLAPLTVLTTAAAAFFVAFALTPSQGRIDGSRAYFTRTLQSLGPMSAPERLGLAFFLAAMILSFTRQFYAGWLPGLTPPIAFLACGLAGFAIRHHGTPLLEWDYVQSHMVWGLIFLFAGGSALGQVLNDTGTARYLADLLVPLAGGGGAVAIVVFTFLSIVITQITSNTAAAAIVVPITISTFERLGMNPVPFVYVVGVAVNFGVMLPSSSAGPAIATGYGADLRTMFWQGARLIALLFVMLVVGGYLLARYWPDFGTA